MTTSVIRPEWPAARAQALVTTAALGDAGSDAGRSRLRALLPAEPRWLHQVHGARVIDADRTTTLVQADAAVARERGTVCIVKIADCMPVLFADDAGSVAAAAHAGWRGLAAGVLEATVDATRAPAGTLSAWLGPAIGPRVYEVGEEVRAALGGPDAAFNATRPGHWRSLLGSLNQSEYFTSLARRPSPFSKTCWRVSGVSGSVRSNQNLRRSFA